MADPPVKIRALQEQAALEIQWKDGTIQRMPFKFVRSQCPCASCVDEITNVRTLDVDSIPEDIKPTDISFSGNYALKFVWSDGHHTGLFTWDHLTKLGTSEEVLTLPRN
jgi:DUF971 family protein